MLETVHEVFIKHKLVLSQRNVQTLKKNIKTIKTIKNEKPGLNQKTDFFGLLRKNLFFCQPWLCVCV